MHVFRTFVVQLNVHAIAVIQQDRGRLEEIYNAYHCISVTHYPCPGCQTPIKAAIKHADIVYGYAWSELHAVAPSFTGATGMSGQNNGDCIEGPLKLGFYLAPGKQSRVCLRREDTLAMCVCEWSAHV